MHTITMATTGCVWYMWVRNATCMRCDIQSQTRDMSLLKNKQTTT